MKHYMKNKILWHSDLNRKQTLKMLSINKKQDYCLSRTTVQVVGSMVIHYKSHQLYCMLVLSSVGVVLVVGGIHSSKRTTEICSTDTLCYSPNA